MDRGNGWRASELQFKVADAGMGWALEALARLPEPLVLGITERLLRQGLPYPEGVDYLLGAVRVMHRHWLALHPIVRRRFIQNIFLQSGLLNQGLRARLNAELGWIPRMLVISPTMRCNLSCQGCYSFNYPRSDELSTERLDQLLAECEELGLHFVLVTGGEPYMRNDLLDLIEAHPTILFLTFTNGLIIAQENLAPRLAALGNVIPCVSVEGFESETDARRGDGMHRVVLRAMAAMRAEGMLFGYSATPMRHNSELVVSDRFVRYYVDRGCRLGWYFSYVPIGRSPDLSLMPTPTQRLHRYHRLRILRRTYDLLLGDTMCDGAMTGGCLSGGRVFVHINAEGGVEPCPFMQFSVDSIHDKSLRDALYSDFIHDTREAIRRVENPLRPCPVTDEPWILRELVARHQARPSQAGGDALLKGEIAAGLNDYAAALKGVFDPIFVQEFLDRPWDRGSSGCAIDVARYRQTGAFDLRSRYPDGAASHRAV